MSSGPSGPMFLFSWITLPVKLWFSTLKKIKNKKNKKQMTAKLGIRLYNIGHYVSETTSDIRNKKYFYE